MIKKNTLTIIISLCILSHVFASDTKAIKIDSLRLVYKNSTDSKQKLDLLYSLCNLTKYSDYDNAIIYGKKGIELAEKLNDQQTKARICNDLGLAYTYQHSFEQAYKQFAIAEQVFNELKDKEMVGVVYNNIGLLYNRQNEYAKELSYHHKALEIFEEKNLPSRKAMSFVNIGKVYVAKKDYESAGEYFIKAYQIYNELSDKKRIVTCLNNIAAVYMYAKKYELSNFYFNKNLELLETLEDVDRNKAMILYNSSGVSMKLGKYKEAEERLTKALILCKKIDDNESLSICYHNFGALYLEKEMYKEAEYNYLKSLDLSIKVGIKELEIENYQHLAKVYANTGEYEKAYNNYIHYAAIKDSIFNQQIRSINDVEKKYLEEKSARQIEAANLAKQQEEHRSEIVKIVSGFFITILFVVIFLVVLKYRDKKKTSIILAEKNKEITDSIQYAKRIQSAILPPNKLVKEYLQESFILYKPKDIVAGDFYWMEHKDNKVLFAAADCTGHGVPGAMVSVVCNNGLNRSVREYGLTDPGKILDKTREIVIQEFEKSEEEVKDGMDIALCSLTGNTLQYAGAHNPLWIIRPVTSSADKQYELIEIKANKQPIGKFDKPEPYTTHTVELQQGDSIYVFSDGYVDQFGGEKGKKFKAKAFRELLLSIQQKNMQEQKELIDEAFESWKGDLEQLDDVCVVGYKHNTI